MGNKTSIYLSTLQRERAQALAQASNRSVSNLVATLLDRAWAAHLEEKEATHLETPETLEAEQSPTMEKVPCSN